MKRCKECGCYLDPGETCDCQKRVCKEDNIIDKLKSKIDDMMSAQTEETMQIKAYAFVCTYYKILKEEYESAICNNAISIVEKRTEHLYILAVQLCNCYISFQKVLSMFEKTDTYKDFIDVSNMYKKIRSKRNES